MAGKYNGVQALTKRKNPQAIFISCFGHSTNLVGTEAAKCVLKATAFFDFVQKLYTFFSASLHRWKIFKSHVPDSPTLKSLSQTRWSARNDAVNALYSGYTGVMDAHESVKEDANEKPEVRLEATGPLRKMEQLEYGILTCFWRALLNRFNSVTTALQSPHLDLNNAVAVMRSLCEYVAEMRDQFDFYEEQGKELSGCQDYKEAVSRVHIRSKRLARFEGAGADAEADLSPKDKFRVGAYLAVIDMTSNELALRLEAYSTVCARFGFLHRLINLDSSEIREFANALIESSCLLPQEAQRTFPAKTLPPYWSTMSLSPAHFAQKPSCHSNSVPAHPRWWWTPASGVGPKACRRRAMAHVFVWQASCLA